MELQQSDAAGAADGGGEGIDVSFVCQLLHLLFLALMQRRVLCRLNVIYTYNNGIEYFCLRLFTGIVFFTDEEEGEKKKEEEQEEEKKECADIHFSSTSSASDFIFSSSAGIKTSQNTSVSLPILLARL